MAQKDDLVRGSVFRIAGRLQPHSKWIRPTTSKCAGMFNRQIRLIDDSGDDQALATSHEGPWAQGSVGPWVRVITRPCIPTYIINSEHSDGVQISPTDHRSFGRGPVGTWGPSCRQSWGITGDGPMSSLSRQDSASTRRLTHVLMTLVIRKLA